MTRNDELELGLAWSPDGLKIAFNGAGDAGPISAVYVMNADGSGQQRLTPNGASPSWLPDGKISFVRVVSMRQPGEFEFYVMNADGSDERNLTRELGLDGFPSWSPDGRRIAVVSRGDRNPNIHVMNADGSEEQGLTPDAPVEQALAWSPDGQKIASMAAAARLRDLRHERRRERAAEADAHPDAE